VRLFFPGAEVLRAASLPVAA